MNKYKFEIEGEWGAILERKEKKWLIRSSTYKWKLFLTSKNISYVQNMYNDKYSKIVMK